MAKYVYTPRNCACGTQLRKWQRQCKACFFKAKPDHKWIRVKAPCVICGVFDIGGQRICYACSKRRAPLMKAAVIAVNRAVREGRLPPVKSKLCVDCGAPAHDYDHRNYSRPLDVEPVCRSCNLRRGPATWDGAPAYAPRMLAWKAA